MTLLTWTHAIDNGWPFFSPATANNELIHASRVLLAICSLPALIIVFCLVIYLRHKREEISWLSFFIFTPVLFLQIGNDND